MIICPKCGDQNVHIQPDEKQMRTFYHCYACEHEWSRVGINRKGDYAVKAKNPYIIPGICLLLVILITVSGVSALRSKNNNDQNVTESVVISEEKKEEELKEENVTEETEDVVSLESIEFGNVKSDVIIGESFNVILKTIPKNADVKKFTWKTSNPSVVNTTQEGEITSVGGGSATITVLADNGVEASFDVNVDGTKAYMQVSTSRIRKDDNNIGDEWTYEFEINGERVNSPMCLSVGDTISFSAKFTEEDTKPDIGTGTASHTVTEEDLKSGFEVSFDVYVTENGGKNSGKSAQFIVTFTFKR